MDAEEKSTSHDRDEAKRKADALRLLCKTRQT